MILDLAPSGIPMPTHDFSAPALPGTLRISVIANGDTYVTDLPSAKLASTLRAFEEFVGPDMSEDRCTEIATDAAENGDDYLVAVGALWLFLRMSDFKHAMNRERMDTIVKAGGCAMLTITTDSREGGWQFKLYELPIRPTVVAPYRATRFDRRRRWK
jgi:hypothetical protein